MREGISGTGKGTGTHLQGCGGQEGASELELKRWQAWNMLDQGARTWLGLMGSHWGSKAEGCRV